MIAAGADGKALDAAAETRYSCSPSVHQCFIPAIARAYGCDAWAKSRACGALASAALARGRGQVPARARLPAVTFARWRALRCLTYGHRPLVRYWRLRLASMASAAGLLRRPSSMAKRLFLTAPPSSGSPRLRPAEGPRPHRHRYRKSVSIVDRHTPLPSSTSLRTHAPRFLTDRRRYGAGGVVRTLKAKISPDTARRQKR